MISPSRKKAHYNYHYKLGLNIIPPKKVKLDIANPCSAGGLYFTYSTSGGWYKNHCFDVFIPNDAQVIIEKDNKFKTDKLVILNEVSDKWYCDHIQFNLNWLKNIKNQTQEVCTLAVRESSQICQRSDSGDLCFGSPAEWICSSIRQKSDS